MKSCLTGNEVILNQEEECKRTLRALDKNTEALCELFHRLQHGRRVLFHLEQL